MGEIVEYEASFMCFKQTLLSLSFVQPDSRWFENEDDSARRDRLLLQLNIPKECSFFLALHSTLSIDLVDRLSNSNSNSLTFQLSTP